MLLELIKSLHSIVDDPTTNHPSHNRRLHKSTIETRQWKSNEDLQDGQNSLESIDSKLIRHVLK
jgi:hypothetical protein